MEGIITSFRRGRKTQHNHQMLLQFPSVDSKEKAEKLIGKTVAWHAPGKEKKVLKGKITGVHGGKGAVRALFEVGLPGQAVTEKIIIE